MKIKLIAPRMSLRPMDSEYKRVLSPSIALLTVAALTPKEYTVYIEDENTCPLNLDDKPDVVGITVNVDTSRRAYEIAGHYRGKGIPVILGGIHASANPEEAANYADAVCIGEAESLWQSILSDIRERRLKKKYSSDKPADLALTPSPRWDLLDHSRYLYTNIICASRSCPFQCEFCYNSCDYLHHVYRNRPLKNVIAEIKNMGTKHVMFIDDNFIGDINWAKEFARAVKPLGLIWNAAVSTNIGQHPDLLDEMRTSGCQSLFIGFETINQESLKSVKKRQNNINNFEQLIKEIHQRGIMINASMAFGFDYDYPDVFKNTLDWLVRNRIETVTAHILTPYPGTTLYKRLLAENRIIDFDWRNYNTAKVVFKPKHLTEEELYDGYLWLYNEFYSLGNILKRLPVYKKQWMPYLLFNLGYRKFGKITARLGRFGLMHSIGKVARRLSYGVG